jgi:hypothetical protein
MSRKGQIVKMQVCPSTALRKEEIYQQNFQKIIPIKNAKVQYTSIAGIAKK